MEIVFGTICFIGAILNFVFWKKHQDKDLLWFAVISSIGFLTALIGYFVKYVFLIPADAFFIVNSFFLIVNSVAFVSLIMIGFKMLMKKKLKTPFLSAIHS